MWRDKKDAVQLLTLFSHINFLFKKGTWAELTLSYLSEPDEIELLQFKGPNIKSLNLASSNMRRRLLLSSFGNEARLSLLGTRWMARMSYLTPLSHIKTWKNWALLHINSFNFSTMIKSWWLNLSKLNLTKWYSYFTDMFIYETSWLMCLKWPKLNNLPRIDQILEKSEKLQWPKSDYFVTTVKQLFYARQQTSCPN